MVLDNINSSGNWGKQANNLNNNFNKTNAEIIALQGIANGGGKLFATVELLTAAYPNLTTSNVGIYAYVSANLTFPAKIYRWSGTAWSDTGQTGNGGDAPKELDAYIGGPTYASEDPSIVIDCSDPALVPNVSITER